MTYAVFHCYVNDRGVYSSRRKTFRSLSKYSVQRIGEIVYSVGIFILFFFFINLEMRNKYVIVYEFGIMKTKTLPRMGPSKRNLTSLKLVRDVCGLNNYSVQEVLEI